MITSNNIDLSKLCSSIRNRGLDLDSSSEQFINIGSNSRMTEIQALLGIYQLKEFKNSIYIEIGSQKFITRTYFLF